MRKVFRYVTAGCGSRPSVGLQVHKGISCRPITVFLASGSPKLGSLRENGSGLASAFASLLVVVSRDPDDVQFF